jgi:hypothetical protein
VIRPLTQSGCGRSDIYAAAPRSKILRTFFGRSAQVVASTLDADGFRAMYFTTRFSTPALKAFRVALAGRRAGS